MCLYVDIYGRFFSFDWYVVCIQNEVGHETIRYGCIHSNRREREREIFREEKMRKMIVVALAFISFYRKGAEDAAF